MLFFNSFWKYKWFWICFHAILGLVSTTDPSLLIIWFYLFAFFSVFNIIYSKQSKLIILFSSAYLVGIEILSRMASASPIIPHEIGKYFLSFVFILGILSNLIHKRSIGKLGILITLFSLPSILAITYEEELFENIVFNLGGILVLGLGVMIFQNSKMSILVLNPLLRVFLFPLISILSFIVIKTPNLNDINFGLYAISTTTGGFGSNQVSTILGLGTLVCAVLLFFNMRFFKNRIYDIFLLVVFASRTLLSFSRGGFLTPIISFILAILITKKPLPFSRSKNLKLSFNPSTIFLLLFSISVSFYFLNKATNNLLFLRYSGETSATFAGQREKSLSTISSGRFDLIVSELKIFTENPILGVGPGGGKYYRYNQGGFKSVSHSEFTRLLGEHGLFGLSILIAIIIFPINFYSRNKRNPYIFINIVFFIFALATSFHSAMRTIVTPVFYIIGSIVYLPPDQSRKQIA